MEKDIWTSHHEYLALKQTSPYLEGPSDISARYLLEIDGITYSISQGIINVIEILLWMLLSVELPMKKSHSYRYADIIIKKTSL